jgi:hypothetical protein
LQAFTLFFVEREALVDEIATLFFGLEELRESLTDLPDEVARPLVLALAALKQRAHGLLAEASSGGAITPRPALRPRVAAADRDRTAS